MKSSGVCCVINNRKVTLSDGKSLGVPELSTKDKIKLYVFFFNFAV